MDTLDIFKSVINNILTALYQPFWFALLLAFFISFFYLYCNNPVDAGRGYKAAIKGWWREFGNSSFFRRFFVLTFCTVMILFRTLLNRSMWANPLSNIMGGWWIWKTASNGDVTLTTECFENLVMMLPFTILLFWTYGDRIFKKVVLGSVIWHSVKISFLFSLLIEMLQLFLRLGSWQFSDLAYNTLGGLLGGLVYWIGWKVKHRITTDN